MDFGEALAYLRQGKRVTRDGWNGRGMWIPEGTVCAFRPYLMMKTVDGDFVPWVASQTDVLAEDWMLVS